ncbi:MAG: putative Rossmann fold flavoprotein [Chlamydiales bacterium]|jgi:predicted Rossmann fold flavoprotein
MKNEKIDYIVIGGGAAGFFGAIACAQANPDKKIVILEKTQQLLTKVKISGGGRCNVTHSCFDPAALVKNYPRGNRNLRGAFSRFQPQDTIEWFKERGIELKTEKDGRMFPLSNKSQTIIDCLQGEAQKSGVEVLTGVAVKNVTPKEKGFELSFSKNPPITCEKILLASGSNRQVYSWVEALGHTTESQVPSLFTFNVPTSPLLELSGASLENVHLKIAGTSLSQTGPLMLTHWGFSGPAVLKLSAWGARILHDMDYKAKLVINWLPEMNQEECYHRLLKIKEENAPRSLTSSTPFPIPNKLWQKLVTLAGFSKEQRWVDLPKKQARKLSEMLISSTYDINGKTTFKEEFVTCGGIKLDEVNFKTMESKIIPGLYFAGEVLNIDGITGGFNFQNAWTTSWIAGNAMASA